MQLKETVDYINEKTNNFAPEIAIVLGSGLGDFADDFVISHCHTRIFLVLRHQQ